MLATRLAEASTTKRFRRLESWSVRVGLFVLGVGVLGSSACVRDIGFGVLVVTLAVNIAAAIARRRDKRT